MNNPNEEPEVPDIELIKLFDDLDMSITFEDSDSLEEIMRLERVDEEIIETVMSELEETDEEYHNVLFVSTDGGRTVKGIHVPAAAIDGKDGPVLFPAANNRVVIAAFSREYIQKNSDRIGELDPEMREDVWAEFINDMHDLVTLELYANPPKWEEI